MTTKIAAFFLENGVLFFLCLIIHNKYDNNNCISKLLLLQSIDCSQFSNFSFLLFVVVRLKWKINLNFSRLVYWISNNEILRNYFGLECKYNAICVYQKDIICINVLLLNITKYNFVVLYCLSSYLVIFEDIIEINSVTHSLLHFLQPIICVIQSSILYFIFHRLITSFYISSRISYF